MKHRQIYLKSVIVTVCFILFLPALTKSANYLQPAFITNIYLTNSLVQKGNTLQPDIIVNALRTNDPQAVTHLVIDLVGNKGVHNLEVEIIDMNGRLVSPVLKLNSWTAENNDAYFRVTTRLSGRFPEGGVFFKIFDTLDSGSKTMLGLFRVLTIK
jgi:hypothetical protein